MKIYVGNLPWSVDEEGLKNLFSSFTVEEASLIKDKFSGRSKGFGFVTIPDTEASNAIAELNNKEVDGRKLRVSEAKPMEPRAEGDRPRRSFGGNRSFGGRGSFGGGRGPRY